jgi:hypothetical protein
MGDVRDEFDKGRVRATRENLREELLSHPCRYFLISMVDNRAVLCIQTCDSIGENLQSHVVDGLVPYSDGNLVSVFEEELHLVIKDWRRLNSEELHSISPAIAEKIRFSPGFVDWIISTVLTKDRNIIIYPAFWS